MFKFSLDKAIQAIGVIFREEDSTVLEYLRIIKLLYIAERESISEIGRTIIGDRIVAMDDGPVMSHVYDLMKGSAVPGEAEKWSRFIKRTGRYALTMHDSPGIGQLSKYEIQKLQDVTRRYLGVNQWKIVDDVHQFKEWKDFYVPHTSSHIPVKSIFEAVGKSDKFAGAVRAVNEDELFDRFFQGTGK